ncbi:MAG: hypothetical protein LBT33_05345, partial [Spirochaetia bacterium]|nr:hypothetical protein [Spirochaetia bacterium]
ERIARLVVFLYPLRGYKNTARPCNLGWSHPFGMLLAHATWAGRIPSGCCSPMQPGFFAAKPQKMCQNDQCD